MSDALRLTDVQAFYGDGHILHGVSFALQPGKVLALLGRNGSGKTTCISTIIGFLKPRAGEIRLFGQAIEGLSPERISHLGIGLVPQGRRTFPSLSVWEISSWRSNAAATLQRPGTSIGSTTCFRGWASATRKWPARFPAASCRCWRSAGH